MMKSHIQKEECAIDFDVYGFAVHVIFTKDDLQVTRDAYDTVIGRKDKVDGAAAFHNATGNRSYLFFKWNATEEHIAHESWHAIRYMLKDYIGSELENETVAYHLGHLVGTIHNFKRYIRKEKKRNGSNKIYSTLHGSVPRKLRSR
jgi:hypothetical protein